MLEVGSSAFQDWLFRQKSFHLNTVKLVSADLKRLLNIPYMKVPIPEVSFSHDFNGRVSQCGLEVTHLVRVHWAEVRLQLEICRVDGMVGAIGIFLCLSLGDS